MIFFRSARRKLRRQALGDFQIEGRVDVQGPFFRQIDGVDGIAIERTAIEEERGSEYVYRPGANEDRLDILPAGHAIDLRAAQVPAGAAVRLEAVHGVGGMNAIALVDRNDGVGVFLDGEFDGAIEIAGKSER